MIVLTSNGFELRNHKESCGCEVKYTAFPIEKKDGSRRVEICPKIEYCKTHIVGEIIVRAANSEDFDT